MELSNDGWKRPRKNAHGVTYSKPSKRLRRKSTNGSNIIMNYECAHVWDIRAPTSTKKHSKKSQPKLYNVNRGHYSSANYFWSQFFFDHDLLFFSLKNISKVENVFPSNLLISFLVFLRVSSGSIFPGTAFFISPLIREKGQFSRKFTNCAWGNENKIALLFVLLLDLIVLNNPIPNPNNQRLRGFYH